MRILSHRGYWKSTSEKNTPAAFNRSFGLSFGTETDLRDLDGELVIAHDPPERGALSFQDFIKNYRDCNLPLAFNIKSDGLAKLLKTAVEKAGLTNFFVFDMSVPDLRQYRDLKIPYFTRMSEQELTPSFLEEAAGIWLDAFDGTWFDANRLSALLSSGKDVCVVSPELHGRQHEPTWSLIRAFRRHDNLMICTDLPEEARAYFGEIA